jgi:hypothetical protein
VQNETNGDSSLPASAVPQTTGENNETAGAVPAIRTVSQEKRLEQMRQLAEIFAAIFETLPDGSAPINSMEKAA